MENIFKSLSESVSEQCYDEIMGLVEDVLSQIKKVHGEPGYFIDGRNKAAELTDKARENRSKELDQTIMREKGRNELYGFAKQRVEDKRGWYGTKNEKGRMKTQDRRPQRGWFNHKSPNEKIDASINRHNKKNK